MATADPPQGSMNEATKHEVRNLGSGSCEILQTELSLLNRIVQNCKRKMTDKTRVETSPKCVSEYSIRIPSNWKKRWQNVSVVQPHARAHEKGALADRFLRHHAQKFSARQGCFEDFSGGEKSIASVSLQS